MMVKKDGQKQTIEKTAEKIATNKQLDELRNQLVRALADYDNLKKRVEKEKEIWLTTLRQDILGEFLPVLDTLENAQKHLNDEGLRMAINQFKKVLNEEGLEEICPQEGDEFNHELHEAIESVKGENKGKIAETVSKGWKFKEGPVVRHAKVKVYGEELSASKKEKLEKEMGRGEYM